MAKVKNIVNAPLFSRTFAAIIDLVLVIFIGAGIFLGISTLASNINPAKGYKDDYNQTIVDSGLMKLEKENLVPYEYDNYLNYQEQFYNFYHEYYFKEVNKNQEDYDIYFMVNKMV